MFLYHMIRYWMVVAAIHWLVYGAVRSLSHKVAEIGTEYEHVGNCEKGHPLIRDARANLRV